MGGASKFILHTDSPCAAKHCFMIDSALTYNIVSILDMTAAG